LPRLISHMADAGFDLRIRRATSLVDVIDLGDPIFKHKWRETPRRADWDQSRRLYV